MKKFAFLASMALLASLSAGVARAGIVFDSLPPTVASTGLDSLGTYVMAQSFTTGSVASVIDSITLPLSSSDLSSGAAFVLAVYRDSGSGTPDDNGGMAGLYVPDSSVNSLSSTNYTFNSSSFLLNDVLAPNTRYWVGAWSSAIVTGVSSVNWHWTSSTSGVGVAGSLYAYSTDAGSTWTTGAADVDGSYQMQVVTSAVPEPGTMVLAGLVCGMGGVIYRRRTAAKPAVA